MRHLVIVFALLGCGHKDECERLIERAAEVGAIMGEHPNGDPAKDLADCRAHIDEVRRNPIAICVLAASSTDEAKACVAGPLQSQRDDALAARKAAIQQAAAKQAAAQQAAAQPHDAVGPLSAQLADVNKQIDALLQPRHAAEPDVPTKYAALVAQRKDLEAKLAEAKRAAAP